MKFLTQKTEFPNVSFIEPLGNSVFLFYYDDELISSLSLDISDVETSISKLDSIFSKAKASFKDLADSYVSSFQKTDGVIEKFASNVKKSINSINKLTIKLNFDSAIKQIQALSASIDLAKDKMSQLSNIEPKISPIEPKITSPELKNTSNTDFKVHGSLSEVAKDLNNVAIAANNLSKNLSKIPLHEQIANAASSGKRTYISDLRKQFPVPKEEFDKALTEGATKGNFSLYRLDDPRQITPERRKGQYLTPSGEERHILYADPKSSAPAPARSFAENVSLAASNVPKGLLVSQKAFLSDIHEQYNKIVGAAKLNLEEFKKQVIDSEEIRTGGSFARVDLVQAFDKHKVAASESGYLDINALKVKPASVPAPDQTQTPKNIPSPLSPQQVILDTLQAKMKADGKNISRKFNELRQELNLSKETFNTAVDNLIKSGEITKTTRGLKLPPSDVISRQVSNLPDIHRADDLKPELVKNPRSRTVTSLPKEDSKFADLTANEQQILDLVRTQIGQPLKLKGFDENKKASLFNSYKNALRELSQQKLDLKINDTDLQRAFDAAKAGEEDLFKLEFELQKVGQGFKKLIDITRQYGDENSKVVSKALREEERLASQNKQTQALKKLPEAYDIVTQGQGNIPPILSKLNKDGENEIPRLATSGDIGRLSSNFTKIATLIAQGKVTLGEYEDILNRVANKEIIPPNASQAAGQLASAVRNVAGTIDIANNRANSFNTALLSMSSLVRLTLVSQFYALQGAIQQAFSQGIQDANKLITQIAQIRTITQDANVSTQEWTASLREVSEASGQNITEVSIAAYNALSNQITKTKADTQDFLTTALEFSRTVGAAPVDSVNLLSSVINSFGKSASDARRISAEFFATIDIGRIRAEDLANIFGRAGIAGERLGASTTELNAALAVLTQNGLTTEDAVTRLNNLFVKLLNPTKEMQKLFGQFGVSGGSQLVSLNGFAGAIQSIEGAIKNGNAALEELFPEIRTLAGFLGLSGSNATKFAEALDYLTNSTETYDKATKETITAPFKLAQEFEKLKNLFTVDFGTSVVETLANVNEKIGGISNTVNTLSGPISLISKEIGQLGVTFAALAAARAGLTALITVWTSLETATRSYNTALISVNAASVALNKSFLTNPYALAFFTGAAAAQAFIYILDRIKVNAEQAVGEAKKLAGLKFQEQNIRFTAKIDSAVSLYNTVKNELSSSFTTAFSRINIGFTEMIRRQEAEVKGLTNIVETAFAGVENILGKTVTAIENSIKEAEQLQRSVPKEAIQYRSELDVRALQNRLTNQKSIDEAAGIKGPSFEQFRIYEQLANKYIEGANRFRQEGLNLLKKTGNIPEFKTAFDASINELKRAEEVYNQLETEINDSRKGGTERGSLLHFAPIDAEMQRIRTAIDASRQEEITGAQEAKKSGEAALERVRKVLEQVSQIKKEVTDIDLSKLSEVSNVVTSGKPISEQLKDRERDLLRGQHSNVISIKADLDIDTGKALSKVADIEREIIDSFRKDAPDLVIKTKKTDLDKATKDLFDALEKNRPDFINQDQLDKAKRNITKLQQENLNKPVASTGEQVIQKAEDIVRQRIEEVAKNYQRLQGLLQNPQARADIKQYDELPALESMLHRLGEVFNNLNSKRLDLALDQVKFSQFQRNAQKSTDDIKAFSDEVKRLSGTVLPDLNTSLKGLFEGVAGKTEVLSRSIVELTGKSFIKTDPKTKDDINTIVEAFQRLQAINIDDKKLSNSIKEAETRAVELKDKITKNPLDINIETNKKDLEETNKRIADLYSKKNLNSDSSRDAIDSINAIDQSITNLQAKSKEPIQPFSSNTSTLLRGVDFDAIKTQLSSLRDSYEQTKSQLDEQIIIRSNIENIVLQLNGLKTSFSAGLLPALTASNDAFKSWSSNNKNYIEQLVGAVGGLEAKIKELQGTLNSFNISKLGTEAASPPAANVSGPIIAPTNQAKGGLIKYYSEGTKLEDLGFKPKGTDKIPAMLTKGEYVMPEKETKKYYPVLEKMRQGTLGSKVEYRSNGGAIGSSPALNFGQVNVPIDPLTGIIDLSKYKPRDYSMSGTSYSDSAVKALLSMHEGGKILGYQEGGIVINNLLSKLNPISNMTLSYMKKMHENKKTKDTVYSNRQSKESSIINYYQNGGMDWNEKTKLFGMLANSMPEKEIQIVHDKELHKGINRLSNNTERAKFYDMINEKHSQGHITWDERNKLFEVIGKKNIQDSTVKTYKEGDLTWNERTKFLSLITKNHKYDQNYNFITNKIMNSGDSDISYYNDGGWVYFKPKGTDTIPAMLTKGEYVMPQSRTRQYLPILEKMRAGLYSQGGVVEYYADGGEVGNRVDELKKEWTKKDFKSKDSVSVDKLTQLFMKHPEKSYDLADHLYERSAPRKQVTEMARGRDTTHSSTKLLSGMFGGHGPNIVFDQGSFSDKRNDTISISSKPTKITIDPIATLNHELEHSKQISSSIRGLSDLHLDMRSISKEIPPSLGDIAFAAQSYKLTNRKPLDTNVQLTNNSRNNVSHSADWIASQAEKHGYFKGRSMTELLSTPSGLAYTKRLLNIGSGFKKPDFKKLDFSQGGMILSRGYSAGGLLLTQGTYYPKKKNKFDISRGYDDGGYIGDDDPNRKYFGDLDKLRTGEASYIPNPLPQADLKKYQENFADLHQAYSRYIVSKNYNPTINYDQWKEYYQRGETPPVRNQTVLSPTPIPIPLRLANTNVKTNFFDQPQKLDPNKDFYSAHNAYSRFLVSGTYNSDINYDQFIKGYNEGQYRLTDAELFKRQNTIKSIKGVDFSGSGNITSFGNRNIRDLSRPKTIEADFNNLSNVFSNPNDIIPNINKSNINQTKINQTKINKSNVDFNNLSNVFSNPTDIVKKSRKEVITEILHKDKRLKNLKLNPDKLIPFDRYFTKDELKSILTARAFNDGGMVDKQEMLYQQMANLRYGEDLAGQRVKNNKYLTPNVQSTSVDNSATTHVNIHVNVNGDVTREDLGRKIGRQIQKEVRRGNLKF